MMYMPQVQNDRIWAVVGSVWGLLIIWMLIINLVTFLIFGVDKWKAKRKVKREDIRRIPEKTLFVLAAVGGSAGALLGMRIWHHKTLHKSFRYGIPAILVLQVILLTLLVFYGLR